jgi:hypothetical protein
VPEFSSVIPFSSHAPSEAMLLKRIVMSPYFLPINSGRFSVIVIIYRCRRRGMACYKGLMKAVCRGFGKLPSSKPRAFKRVHLSGSDLYFGDKEC